MKSALKTLTRSAEPHGFTVTHDAALRKFDIEGHGITGVIKSDYGHPDGQTAWIAEVELDRETWGDSDGEPHFAIIGSDQWVWMTLSDGHPAECQLKAIQSILCAMPTEEEDIVSTLESVLFA
jgi:hypothetical protein